MSSWFKTKVPHVPAAQIPETPKPTVRKDTGASIALGSGDVQSASSTGNSAGDATKNQRVSGRSAARKKTSSVNILGGLGKSGLNI